MNVLSCLRAKSCYLLRSISFRVLDACIAHETKTNRMHHTDVGKRFCRFCFHSKIKCLIKVHPLVHGFERTSYIKVVENPTGAGVGLKVDPIEFRPVGS